MTRIVTAVSGKGGVGKTNVICNIAIAASERGAKVLLVDGDLGLANADVLLGMTPKNDIGDVLAGRSSLADALVRGPRGVALLPAASGRSELAGLDRDALTSLRALIVDAADDYDLVAIDAGAGVGPVVLAFASLGDPVVLVTTPEPTAIVDAYATLKVLWRQHPHAHVDLLVNNARTPREAAVVAEQLGRLSERFLAKQPRASHWIRADPRLHEAVSRQRAVVDLFPLCEATRQLRDLAGRYLNPKKPSASLEAEGKRP